MPPAADSLVLCVEDELYRGYLEQEFAGTGAACASVALADLAQAITEHPSGILLLQSESDDLNIRSSRGSSRHSGATADDEALTKFF